MKITVKDYCASIEFSSEKANCFSRGMLSELALAIKANQQKAILIRSAGGKTFSAGASFDEFKAIKTKDQAVDYFSCFMEVLEAIRQSSVPIICRVQGRAVGGAVGIISACDYVFAHESAEVKLSELELGIGPFTISPALERKLGIARFSEMVFDMDWKSSNWAQSSGLYTKVFSSLSDLDRHLEVFLGKLCAQSKEAIEKNRNLLWAGTENWPSLFKGRIETVSDLLINK